MAIPDYQSLMLPVLETFAGGEEVSITETRDRVAATLKLSNEELAERLPSGTQSTLANRVGWAVTYRLPPRFPLASLTAPSARRPEDDGKIGRSIRGQPSMSISVEARSTISAAALASKRG